MGETSDATRPALGIAGGNPSYRRGLAAGLEDHGWPLDLVSDAYSWIRRPGPRILLIHLNRPGEEEPLLALDRSSQAHIVALASDPVAEEYVTLIRAGADAIAPSEAEPARVAAVLDALVDGHALLRLTTVHRLAAIARSQPDQPVLAETEIKWLAHLAEGRSINELAALVHRSPRAMHRALTGLYKRIGVDNRDQAVAWAAKHGLLDEGQ